MVGYGTKGSSAVHTLLKNGFDPASIVVVDPDPTRIAEANRRGLVGVVGDGSRSEVLERAEVSFSPKVGQVVQDLLSYGEGLELVERQADARDVGKEPGAVKEPVLAVIRGSPTMRFDDPAIDTVKQTDRLVVVRSVHDRSADPTARRPPGRG